MRTAVSILALFALLHGPVCPMSAFGVPVKAAAPSADHDCCPGGEASDAAPAAPGHQDDGAATAACAAHCASLAQAVAIAPPSVDADAILADSAPLLRIAMPGTALVLHTEILPHRSTLPHAIPLLI